MKITFATLGCKVNQYETEALRRLFEERGWQVVSPGEAADVCVVNSCTVTAEGDRKTRQVLRRMRRSLEELVIEGYPTNASLAHLVMHNSEFVRGNYDTGFMERNLEKLLELSKTCDTLSGGKEQS